VRRRAPASGDEARGQGGAAGLAFGAWLDQGKQATDDDDRFDLVIAGQYQADIATAPTSDATLLAITWFDPAGPYRDWRADDALIQAMSGVAFGFGMPQGPPILAQGHGPQIVAGLTSFIAAMGALMSAPRPRRIDVNVLEAALCFTEPGAVIASASGLQSGRLGPNRLSPTYPCQVYASADGHVGVTALIPAQWASLAGLIGRPELAGEVRYATTLARLEHADEIDAILGPVFAQQPTDHWISMADALRIPITPVPRPGAAPDVPHWRDRGTFAPLTDEPGAPRAPTLPFRMDWDGVKSPRPFGPASAPLVGVRVADFSMGWAGPLAGRYLADLGADVLKIESTVRPDWWRGWEAGEPADPPLHELHLNFLAVNRGKRGLDLDLTTPGGLEDATAVIAASDVVIENLGPGVMERLGLGPQAQRALRPGIISISMPPFGRTGPLAGLRAYGSTVEHASGMPFVNGLEEWPPCLQHVAYGDPVAGLYAAAAALVALYSREQLGGADVELCQVECLFQLAADAIIGEQVLGRPSPRAGSRRPTVVPCCVVACAGEEAWLAVAADDAAAWQGLCAILGRSDWAGDASLATLAGRAAAAEGLEAGIAAWSAARNAREAAAELQRAGVAAAPVTPAHALPADPQLLHAGFFALQQRRYVGAHLTPQAPFRFDGARPPLCDPAPVLGEHTAQVLAELGSSS
jgi:crotonobetainyl-CoA:carnitine CoA-transferase CaiB-like acyl-CoA transferase